MQIKILIAFPIIVQFLLSCNKSTINVENPKQRILKSKYELVVSDERKYNIDSVTAPRPVYMQYIKGNILTFLNQYNKTIYFYNYNSFKLEKKIFLDKENKLYRIGGYYYINDDSIYVYDVPDVKLYLVDSNGKIKKGIALHDNNHEWPLHYPQYMISTVVPIIRYHGNLIMTGLSFPSLNSSAIDSFHFTSIINIKTSRVKFLFTYPKELYGSDANWEGGLATIVYPVLSANGDIIHSFPVSHNLYISHCDGQKYKTIYGGSNFAKTISSIKHKIKTTPDDLILLNYLQMDMYTAILYDPYRKLYYRFMLRGIPNAKITIPKEEKQIDVIIMDNKFNYLGETIIGKAREWNWTNSFVTHEGLNIEYLSGNINEDYLIFKTFKLELINKNRLK